MTLEIEEANSKMMAQKLIRERIDDLETSIYNELGKLQEEITVLT